MRDAARDSGLTALGRSTVGSLFAKRHDDPMMRNFARASVKDAQFWLRLTGRKARRGS